MRLFKILLVALSFPCFAKSQPGPDGRVSIGKIDSVWSSTLKENRYCLVYTPPSYSNTIYLPKKYPVLYLLDGDVHFHSVTGLLQFLSTGMNGNYVIPEMIVVAIPNTDRTRDLTPTHTDKGPDGREFAFLKTSGGMNNFFKFLKNELIPHVDSNFHTSSYRVLIGHSFGGIAVINALYTMPETFNSYIAIDPSLWYDNQVLLKKAKDYFGKTNLKGKALFLGQANTVEARDTSRNLHFESIVQFNSIMESFNRSGLRYQYKYYGNDDHGSAPLISEYDGLRFIFDGYKVNYSQLAENPSLIKQQFNDLSARLGAEFLPPEEVINNLGYQSMQRGDSAKAIQIFQLNVDLYPASYNVWDSMAEALKYAGDYKKAISYYEKSLSLNPKNENGKEMIKKMKEKKN
jgi:predicted alpha/beta superfamily hydrolase